MRNHTNFCYDMGLVLPKAAISAMVLLISALVTAQSVGINSDGTQPNSNAILDIKSPASGNGKGLLIPRLTESQRTASSSSLAGGLLNDSGNLRGGVAQGLLVYQTDGTQGFYYNKSTTSTPDWIFIGTGGGSVTSVTAGPGLSGGTITDTGTLSLPDTGTAGSYTKVTTDSKGRVTSGSNLDAADIPSLSAAKITTGTLSTARIPSLDAATITTGTLSTARIPSLDAAKIATGTLSTARIPSLDAAKIATGTLSTARIPSLDAAKIATGTVDAARIPNIDASKVTTGTIATTQGGLGSDASSFTGLVYIAGGSSSATTITNAGKNLIDDTNAAAQRTTLGLGSIATQSVPYTLPNANGTNGQVLATNGAGTASWGTVSTPITGSTVKIGNSAVASGNGIAVGVSARSTGVGVTVGYQANSESDGTSVGYQANAESYGAAVGYKANGTDSNVAIGYNANGYAGSGPYVGGVSIGYKSNAYSGNGKYTGGVAIGYRANARHNFNENQAGAVAIGFEANGYIQGAAVGWKAAAYNKGTALGYQASGSNNGTAVGWKANAAMGSYATAIGYQANGGGLKNFTFAKGAFSKCERYNEEWKSSDGYDNKFGQGQVTFHGATANDTPTELFLGGQADQRFFMKNNSAVTFQALVTAINTVTEDSSAWRIWGAIKRRANAGDTALIGVVTTDSQKEGTLSTAPTFDADTTNGSLRVKVTGVSGETVLWNISLTYSEVREAATQ